MTREEFYKLTDILNSEVLGNFMHGGEADEVIAMFEESVEHSNILEQEEPVSEDYDNALHSEALTFLQEQQVVPNLYADMIIRAVKHGAQWQKQKDKAQILILKDQIESCHAAMKCKDELMEIKLHEQKEQMMKGAIQGRWLRNSIVLPCEFDNRFDDGKYVTIIIKED